MHGDNPCPRTLFCLLALRHGAETFSPRYGEGPFNPASIEYRYSIVTRYDNGKQAYKQATSSRD